MPALSINHLEKLHNITLYILVVANYTDLSTKRLNVDMKPKEVLLEAVNKFLKKKLKEIGFVFSDSQLKFTKKLKYGLIKT